MNALKVLAVAAVILNALPLVADARQSAPTPPRAETQPAAESCNRFNVGLYSICLHEAKGNAGKETGCPARFLDNMKQCLPAR